MYHRTLTTDDWSSGNQFRKWVKPIKFSTVRIYTKRKRLIRPWWDPKLTGHEGPEGELAPRQTLEKVCLVVVGERGL